MARKGRLCNRLPERKRRRVFRSFVSAYSQKDMTSTTQGFDSLSHPSQWTAVADIRVRCAAERHQFPSRRPRAFASGPTCCARPARGNLGRRLEAVQDSCRIAHPGNDHRAARQHGDREQSNDGCCLKKGPRQVWGWTTWQCSFSVPIYAGHVGDLSLCRRPSRLHVMRAERAVGLRTKTVRTVR
jgi:hypothetical protein